jgi:hypothetical protein
VLVWKLASFQNLVERFPGFRCITVHALEQRLRELDRVCFAAQQRTDPAVAPGGPRGQRQVENKPFSREIGLTASSLLPISRLLWRVAKIGNRQDQSGAVQVRDLHALTQLSQTEPEKQHRGQYRRTRVIRRKQRLPDDISTAILARSLCGCSRGT